MFYNRYIRASAVEEFIIEDFSHLFSTNSKVLCYFFDTHCTRTQFQSCHYVEDNERLNQEFVILSSHEKDYDDSKDTENKIYNVTTGATFLNSDDMGYGEWTADGNCYWYCVHIDKFSFKSYDDAISKFFSLFPHHQDFQEKEELSLQDSSIEWMKLNDKYYNLVFSRSDNVSDKNLYILKDVDNIKKKLLLNYIDSNKNK